MPRSKGRQSTAEVVDDCISIFHGVEDGGSRADLLPLKPNSDDADKYVYPITAFPPRSAFEVSKEFPALILPAKRTNQVRNQLKSIMLVRPRLSVVVEVSDSDLDPEEDREGGPEWKLTRDNRREYRKIVLHPHRAGLEETDKTNDKRQRENTTKPMHPILQSLLKDEPQSFRLGKHTISLSYDDWSAEEILKRMLVPCGIDEVPSSFEAVGHLAHVNLREEVLPYKFLIGKVLLEKNSPRIQTVCNKLGSIATEFRTFGMEVIAGKAHEKDDEKDGANGTKEKHTNSWSDVFVKEEGCEYQLDFRKVYWNSRLGGEHRRLVQLIKKDAVARSKEQGEESSATKVVVADLMAGIGPFAIPLTAKNLIRGNSNKQTKKNKNKDNNDNNNTDKGGKDCSLPIEVYANDLNPSSYEFLVENAKRNKCDFETNKNFVDYCSDHSYSLHVSNMDARAYCHRLQDERIRPDHFIMNLPATALEFLDCFRGYPDDTNKANDGDGEQQQQQSPRPRIHVHCFAAKDPEASKTEIWKRAETSLGCPLDEDRDQAQLHTVRDVAPNKNMYCLSFLLPAAACALPRIQLGPDTPKEEEKSEAKPEANQEQKRERIEEDADTGSGTESKKQKKAE